jgi:hypothetical protein
MAQKRFWAIFLFRASQCGTGPCRITSTINGITGELAEI